MACEPASGAVSMGNWSTCSTSSMLVSTAPQIHTSACSACNIFLAHVLMAPVLTISSGLGLGIVHSTEKPVWACDG